MGVMRNTPARNNSLNDPLPFSFFKIRKKEKLGKLEIKLEKLGARIFVWKVKE
jgi:hypothetical protein